MSNTTATPCTNFSLSVKNGVRRLKFRCPVCSKSVERKDNANPIDGFFEVIASGRPAIDLCKCGARLSFDVLKHESIADQFLPEFDQLL